MKTFAAAIFCASFALLQANDLNQFPSIGTNGDGNTIVIWQGYDNARLNLLVESASLAHGGSWSAPAELSSVGIPSMYPKVAINSEGDMIAVWEASVNKSISIQASFGTMGGGWQPLETISESASEDTFPEIDIDANGNGLLLWQKKVNGGYLVRTSHYSKESNTWTAPATLNSATRIMPFPEALVNSSGKSVTLWQQFIGLTCVIQAATSSSGEAWSAPVSLSDPAYNCMEAQGAINDSGLVIALWQKGGDTSLYIEGAFCSPEGVWGERFLLTPDGVKAMHPIAVMNNSGKVVAVWQATSMDSPSIQVIQAAVYSDGVWSPVVNLSDSSVTAINPKVAINSNGQAIAVWTANGVVQSILLSTDNAWSSLTALSDPAQVSHYPQVGIDGMGNGVAVWQTAEGSEKQIEAAVYTAGGAWSAKETISNIAQMHVDEPDEISVSVVDFSELKSDL